MQSTQNLPLFRDMTRATQYQAKHNLPGNFSDILKEYTREVLRDQPADLLQWSAEYFKRKAIENDPASAEQTAATTDSSNEQNENNNNAATAAADEAATTASSNAKFNTAGDSAEFEEVAQSMIRLFSAMDDSGTSRLYVHLVQRALLDHFGLTKEQALYILSSENTATRDADGMINFTDFARSSANAVVYFQQSKHKFEVTEQTSVHGLEQSELRDALLRVFRGADSSEGLGRLTFAKFRDALINAPLQLTQRDINVLCAEAEQTSDGFVDVRREAEHAFPLLCLSREFTAFDKEHD